MSKYFKQVRDIRMFCYNCMRERFVKIPKEFSPSDIYCPKCGVDGTDIYVIEISEFYGIPN